MDNVAPAQAQDPEEQLEHHSRLLVSQLKEHGFSDPQSSALFQHVVLESNSLAMLRLSQGSGAEARQWLNKAAALTATVIPDGDLIQGAGASDERKGPASMLGLRVLTLNNLACWQKAGGNAGKAVETLNEVVENLISGSPAPLPPQQLAVTHSNMAASLSSLNDHAGARRHAKIAVQHCKADLKRFSEKVGDSNDVLRDRVMNGSTNSDVPAPREVEVRGCARGANRGRAEKSRELDIRRTSPIFLCIICFCRLHCHF